MNTSRGNCNQNFPDLAFKALEYILHPSPAGFYSNYRLDFFCMVLFTVVSFYVPKHNLSVDQWTRYIRNIIDMIPSSSFCSMQLYIRLYFKHIWCLYKVNLWELISSRCCPCPLHFPMGFDVEMEKLNSSPPFFLVFQTTPGVQKRYFRQIKNLIAAFQKPEQGIAMPLLYPVTAQSRAQTHTEAQKSSNSLSPTNTSPNPYLHQRPPRAAQGQKNRNKKEVRQALG